MKSPSHIFISHPRMAWVVAIVVSLCGAFCLRRMPVAEYPNITPVTITVSTSYTGAGSQEVRDSVAQVIEDQINAVDDIWYYKSNANARGSYNCYCVFRPGTPSNIALVNVQNAVKRAEPKLPTEVVQNGISVRKSPEDQLVQYMFTTDAREMDLMELANFVEKQMADSISRMDGVSLVESGGRTYAMRIWLDPVRLSGLNISIAEVKSAVESQNIQAAAGTVGGEYANDYLSFKVNVKGRLRTKEEFENIVVRTNPETGAQVLLKDVARVELGAKGYAYRSRFNDSNSVWMNVYKAPEANAVATAARVKKEVNRWLKRLPKGVNGYLADDATGFTLLFLKETVWTLFAALALVVLITYVFLQDWRATFIPAVAIPVSLLGTFIVLHVFGFTLNVLTMFGLILVIGSLVDDAIVVVENTQSLMLREGLAPREAAEKSMTQITSAIIATTLVTLACYLPLVFYSGMAGIMYVQFAVTMCTALVISTGVAIVLSPVLCAYMLKAPTDGRRRGVFAPFNAVVDIARRSYLTLARLLVRRVVIALVLFAGVVFSMWWLFGKVPTAFLPKEDRSFIIVRCRLPEGQTLERTIAVVDEFHDRMKGIAGIRFVSSICGWSLWGTGENLANIYLWLDSWDKRSSPELHIDRIMERAVKATEDIYAAQFVFQQLPSIRGLGGSSGVGFNICSVGGQGPQELLDAADGLVAELSTNKLVKSAVHGFTAATPQLELRLDRRKAEALGLTPKVVFQTLQNKFASYYVNDFNLKGGVYEVKLQNDPERRGSVSDVLDIRIPTSSGEAVPLASIASVEHSVGPRETMSYNKMLAAWVDVVPAARERGPAPLAGARRGALRLPLPGGAVRVVDDSRAGDAVGGLRPRRRAPRALAHRHRAFGLRAAGLRDADRACGEERDPDGGVLAPGARAGGSHRQERAPRRGPPVPGGDDDGLELHLRRPAARVQVRRGLRGDAGDRHLHLLGDARGDGGGHILRAAALHGVPERPRARPEAPRGDCGKEGVGCPGQSTTASAGARSARRASGSSPSSGTRTSTSA